MIKEADDPYKPECGPESASGDSVSTKLRSGLAVSVIIATVATPAEALSIASCFLGLFLSFFAGKFIAQRKLVRAAAVSLVALTLLEVYVLPSLHVAQKIAIVGGAIFNLSLAAKAAKVRSKAEIA